MFLVSNLWPLLLLAVKRNVPMAQRAHANAIADKSLTPDPEDVAEHLARILIPSGTADQNTGDATGNPSAWGWNSRHEGWRVYAKTRSIVDSFFEVGEALAVHEQDALHWTDPAHVATLARVCAAVLGAELGAGPMAVECEDCPVGDGAGFEGPGLAVLFRVSPDARPVSHFLRFRNRDSLRRNIGTDLAVWLVFRVAADLSDEAREALENQTDNPEE